MFYDKKDQQLVYSDPITHNADPSKGSLPLDDGEAVLQVLHFSRHVISSFALFFAITSSCGNV